MTAAVGIASVVAFGVAFSLCRVLRVAREAVSTAMGALAALRDPALDDAARERAVRRASLKMLGQFTSILLRGAAVLAVAAVPIVLADRIEVAPARTVVELLSRWDVLLGATLILTIALILKERAWPWR